MKSDRTARTGRWCAAAERPPAKTRGEDAGLAVFAAGHAALVADDDDLEIKPLERRDRRSGAHDEFHLRRIAQITVIVDERVVAAEKDGGVHGDSVA